MEIRLTSRVSSHHHGNDDVHAPENDGSPQSHENEDFPHDFQHPMSASLGAHEQRTVTGRPVEAE